MSKKKKILIVSNYIFFWQTAEFYEVLKHKFDCKIIVPRGYEFILEGIPRDDLIISPFKYLMYLQLLFINKPFSKIFIVDSPEYPAYPNSLKGWLIYLHQILTFLVISIFLRNKLVTYVRDISRYFPNLSEKGKKYISVRNKILLNTNSILCENKHLTEIFKNNLTDEFKKKVRVSTLYTRTSKKIEINLRQQENKKDLLTLGILGGIDDNRKDYNILIKLIRENNLKLKLIFLGRFYKDISSRVIDKFLKIDANIFYNKTKEGVISENDFLELGNQCDLLVSLNLVNHSDLSYGKYKGSGSFGDAILLNKHLVVPSLTDRTKEFKSFSSYYDNYNDFVQIIKKASKEKPNCDFSEFFSKRVFSNIEKDLLL